MLPLAVTGRSKKEKRAMAGEALSQVGLAEKRQRLPGEISGGEKERAAVARAIVNEPPANPATVSAAGRSPPAPGTGHCEPPGPWSTP